MARATQGTIYRKGVAPKGALAAAPDSDDSEAGEDDEKEAEDDEAIEEKVNKREGLVIRKDPSAAVLRVKELDLKPKLVAKPIGVSPSSHFAMKYAPARTQTRKTSSHRPPLKPLPPKRCACVRPSLLIDVNMCAGVLRVRDRLVRGGIRGGGAAQAALQARLCRKVRCHSHSINVSSSHP
jgi:hypothetical protein